jgi:xylan 1,4-beta-xylosidase
MTVCNPLNISYRFQPEGIAEQSFREGADPSVVFYRDTYWLFASKSGGYWYSSDLSSWEYVPSYALAVEDYAPDAAVINDVLYVTASRRGHLCPIYKTRDPFSDQWEKVCDCPEHNDPALFQDDDRRVYRYWGCSNTLPLFCSEMDPDTMLPCGPKVSLFGGDQHNNGWERRGEDHCDSETPPHIEGPWVVKYKGRYYLEYASPGTQYNIYSDAVLSSEKPLGPFTLQKHNPHSYKPGGFIPGAGHGSTFQDRHGNWWHISTMRISVRHKFERRIGIWPAGFDEEGILFCNTAFGDYPMRLPAGKWDPWKDPFPGWMLLSYRAASNASSSHPEHPASEAFDEDVQSYWAAGSSGPAWLAAELDAVCTVHAVQINFTEHEADIHGRPEEEVGFHYNIELSIDGDTWTRVIDTSDKVADLPHDYNELDVPWQARYIRLHIAAVSSGLPAVSGFRVFGNGQGASPGQVESVRVTRDTEDRRNANIEWEPVSQSDGYIVRWGIAPEKLYNSYMVYDSHDLRLGCLDRKQEYFYSVEAFNKNGIGKRRSIS